MKTAIFYASNQGTTKKVANIIREKLDSTTVQIFDMRGKQKVDLSSYETIIIGGSIHAGQIQKVVKKFIHKNMATLMQKRVALFLCCMNETKEKEEFNNSYPEQLRNHSIYNAIVGGEFLFEKMNFVQKIIIHKVSGLSSSVSKLRYSEIDNLVNAVKK